MPATLLLISVVAVYTCLLSLYIEVFVISKQEYTDRLYKGIANSQFTLISDTLHNKESNSL